MPTARKRQKADAPGQELMGEILGSVRRVEQALSGNMTLSVPAGAIVTVAMPEAPTVSLTPTRAAAGFRQLMEMPDREFHEALMQACDKGLNLVSFKKRVNGVFYHSFNRLKKNAAA